MAVRNKINLSGNNIYFITFTILDWLYVFTEEKYCKLVFKWFDYIKENYGNKIYGYVIMPNHIHVILEISERSPVIGKLVQNAKRFLAYGIVDYLEADGRADILSHFQSKANKRKRAKHKVFNHRYDSLILQSLKFFLQKLNYIHNNPCQEKWRLAEYPEEYNYSSAANYISGKGLYVVEVMEF